MGDYDGYSVDDMIDIFEEFVRKSLLLVSLTAGAIVIMVVYALKVFSDRSSPQVAPPLSHMLPNFQSPRGKQTATAKSMSPSSANSNTPSVCFSNKPCDKVSPAGPQGFNNPGSSALSQRTKLLSNKRIQYDELSPQSSGIDPKKPSTNTGTQYIDDVLLNVKPTNNLPDSFYKTPNHESQELPAKDSTDYRNKTTDNYTDETKIKPTRHNLDDTKVKLKRNLFEDEGNDVDNKLMTEDWSYSKNAYPDGLNATSEELNKDIRINITLKISEHGFDPTGTGPGLNVTTTGSNQNQTNAKKLVCPTSDERNIQLNILMRTPEQQIDEPSKLEPLRDIYRNTENKLQPNYYSDEDKNQSIDGNFSKSSEIMRALNTYNPKNSSNTAIPKNNTKACDNSENTHTREFTPNHCSNMDRHSKGKSNPSFGTCPLAYYPSCSRTQSLTSIPRQISGSCCSLCCNSVQDRAIKDKYE